MGFLFNEGDIVTVIYYPGSTAIVTDRYVDMLGRKMYGLSDIQPAMAALEGCRKEKDLRLILYEESAEVENTEVEDTHPTFIYIVVVGIAIILMS